MTASFAAGTATPTLRGRDADRATVRRALSAASGPRAILLAGPAGIGKTALARDACESLGGGSEWVHALPGGQSMPLSALAPLLERTDGQQSRGPRRPLAEELIGWAVAVLARPQVPLVVDDVPLLDDLSRVVLGHLLAERSRPMVLTARTPPVIPAPVADLLRTVPRIDLRPLTGSDVEALAVDWLGGPVARALVAVLLRLSDGNPLYINELLASAKRDGTLQHRLGLWELDGRLVPPPRLVEAVEVRMAGLDDRSRQLIELVAVGEPLRLEALEGLVDVDILPDLERQRLVVLDEGDALRLAHPLYGEVVRDGLGPLSVRRIQRTLAGVMEREGALPDERLRAVRWRLDAGEPLPVETLLQAAADAQRRADLDLAERAARAAHAEDPGLHTAVVLGEVLAMRRDHVGAVELFTQLMAQLAAADAPPDPDDVVSLALSHAFTLYHGLGRQQDAYDVLSAAQGSLVDPVRQARLQTYRASLLVFDGQPMRGLDELDPLIDAAVAVLDEDDGGSEAQVVTAHASALLVEAGIMALTAGTMIGCLARNEELRGTLQRVASAAPAHAVYDPHVGANTEMYDLVASGRLDGVADVSERHRRTATAMGSVWGLAWIDTFEGEAALLAGRFQEAARAYRQAVEGLQAAQGVDPGVVLPGAGLVQALVLSGALDQARQALAEVRELTVTGYRAFDGVLERARAWVVLAGGDLAGGAGVLAAAAAVCTDQTVWVVESTLLHDLVRLGRADRMHLDRLAVLADAVEGPLMAARALHASSWVGEGDVDGLEEAGEAFRAIGADLFAAEALAQAAVVAERRGSSRRATGLATRSRALCTAPTPALLALRRPVELTAREQDVALLAATGMSSAEIADRLSLSVRTVDNHLGRVFRKLGITSRTGLAEAMGG